MHGYVVPHVPGIPHTRPESGPAKDRAYPPYGTNEWPASTNPDYKPTEADKAEAMDKKNAEAVPLVTPEKAAAAAAAVAAGPTPTA